MGEQKHMGFADGLSTKPDVDLLLATWADPKTDDQFSYESIGKLIGTNWPSNRFRSVTQSWRKRLLERGIVVNCKASAGFYVASVDQITSETHSVLTFVARKAKRHRTKLRTAESKVGLTEFQRMTVEHQGQMMNGLEKDAKKQRMNLLPNTATASEQVKKLPSEKSSRIANGPT